jgi:hypothetical protein
MNDNIIQQLKDEGVIKIPNFFNSEELDFTRKIINKYKAPKGDPMSYFSTNNKHLFYKILKFKFKKFLEDKKILSIAKEKKIGVLASQFFGEASYLKFIDGYYSPISNKDVLPWHTDQSYEGDEKNQTGYVNPDHGHLKFFIYLTKVSSNNGCMSYIPKSHKIGYAIRKGVYEGQLKYQPYFTIKDFRNFILLKENASYVKNHINNLDLYDNFLDDTHFAKEDGDTTKFDYEMSPGDAIVFDEGGVHKGSKSLINDRMVLRYLYSIKK